MTESALQKKPSMPEQDGESLVPLQIQTNEEAKSSRAIHKVNFEADSRSRTNNASKSSQRSSESQNKNELIK